MEEELLETLFDLIRIMGQMALDVDEQAQLQVAVERSKRYLYDVLEARRDYAGICYWYHAESDCAIQTFGPYEAYRAANAGCEPISRDAYLDHEVGDLI